MHGNAWARRLLGAAKVPSRVLTTAVVLAGGVPTYLVPNFISLCVPRRRIRPPSSLRSLSDHSEVACVRVPRRRTTPLAGSFTRTYEAQHLVAEEAGEREKDAPRPPRERTATVAESALARSLSLVGIGLEEKDFTIWGASPLAHDGEVHLYVARWPEPNVDPAWRRSSEIAHYVSSSPEGPFRFSDVALTGTGRDTWDRYSAHNPEARYCDGAFVLLYVSNSDYRQPPHPLNQRIGMAVAPSPSGPWRREGRDGLILESSKDPGHWTYGSHVVNPALLQVGSRYHLYFKSKCQGQAGMVYGVATADRFQGPYTIADRPLTTEGVVIEDGAAFEWKGKVCLLTTDNHGKVTGVRGGGALWVSEDGLSFRREWVQLGYDRIPRYFPGYDPGRVVRIYGGDPKWERPKILMQGGQPRYLYAPSGWNVFGGPRTVLHVLRLDLKASDGPLPDEERQRS